ncbi:MAG: glucose-6-phosphate isomerase [Proteobacteria bacterium]|nr:glucose-6-phosphate isomerase [Pseudomonadota bacterium]
MDYVLPIKQDISGCLRAVAGPVAMDEGELAPLLRQCEAARLRFTAELAAGRLAPLALARQRDDLTGLQTIAADWRRRFRRVVLFGTGGSALGARTLAALAAPASAGKRSQDESPVLCVPDNLDPDLMARVLTSDDLAETGFLVISKSGGTGETLAQALTAVTAVRDGLGTAALAKHFLAISEPGQGALRRLSADIGAQVLDHDPDVDGRFSVLSLVGLLPAMMLGLDAAAVRNGAEAVLAHTLATPDSPPAMGAALQVGLQRHGLNLSVLLAYGEAFKPFVRWYRQLWAESLGKQGHGTTPIDALGPVDQHSQLQLYLDGPVDKQFTLLMLQQAGRGPVVDADLATGLGQDYLAGRRIGDLVAAMQAATADTLIRQGRPVRRLTVQCLDETSMGALLMHFMLETLFAADLMGVDPFGQPAVEESKVLARRYLKELAP